VHRAKNSNGWGEATDEPSCGIRLFLLIGRIPPRSAAPTAIGATRNLVFPSGAVKWHNVVLMIIRRANERGHAHHGWLDTYHTFSFADYYDPQWLGFRCLRVINDDLVQPGMGFGRHPHRDMEIITCLLSGALEHRDSMGNGRIIRAGEVQYMAAGSGVEHSEFNPSPDEATRLLQIWIQPDTKGVPPRYAEKSFAHAAPGAWHLVTSRTGRDGSIAIHQDADLWLAKLDGGHQVKHLLAPNRHAWLHVAAGAVNLNGTELFAGDAVGLSTETTLHLAATQPSQVLLFDLN